MTVPLGGLMLVDVGGGAKAAIGRAQAMMDGTDCGKHTTSRQAVTGSRPRREASFFILQAQHGHAPKGDINPRTVVLVFR